MLLAVHATVLVACSRQQQEVRVWESSPCNPPLTTLNIGDVADPSIEARLQAIFEKDQAARKSTNVDMQQMSLEDTERRKEVLELLKTGQVSSGSALYAAAMVFQHGNCPDHYRLANDLASKAMTKGDPRASWLYAASLDRYLLSQGKPQKFGTQYRIVGDNMELLPVDPSTTDEERAKYGLPTLSQAKSMTLPEPVKTSGPQPGRQ